MKTTFKIQVRETGDILEDGILAKEDAIATVARMEAEDKEEGNYSEDWYEIVKVEQRFRIIAKTNPWQYERVAHGEGTILRRDSGIVVWVWKSGFDSVKSIQEEFRSWSDVRYAYYDDEAIQAEIDNLELDMTIDQWKKENYWYEGPGWYNDHELVYAKDGEYYREGYMTWEWESYFESSTI